MLRWTQLLFSGGVALIALLSILPESGFAQENEEKQKPWGTFELRGSKAEGHVRYVPPLSNPLFNETPFITTEARPIFLYNEIPDGFLTDGGSIKVYALELRFAITERIGIIASKDGYVDLNFEDGLKDESGLADFSLGVKAALYSDPEQLTILTAGVEYEMPSGNLRVGGIEIQGGGDGFLDLFLSGATVFGGLGLQASTGLNLALDTDHDTSMLHYSVHADYEVTESFFPLLEVNGFTTVEKGGRTPFNFEGLDLVNFGSRDSGTVVTGAVGGRYVFNEHFQIGSGYEFPLTEREDLMDWRFYLDAVLTF